MNNIKRRLSEQIRFEEFVTERAYQKMMASGCKLKMYSFADSVEYSLESVSFKFCENTRHDCPDYLHIELSLREMELGDSKWLEYIGTIRNEFELKEKNRLQLAEMQMLKEKQRQFERLKNELGYNKEPKERPTP
jgi:hypothetical protein